MEQVKQTTDKLRVGDVVVYRDSEGHLAYAPGLIEGHANGDYQVRWPDTGTRNAYPRESLCRLVRETDGRPVPTVGFEELAAKQAERRQEQWNRMPSEVTDALDKLAAEGLMWMGYLPLLANAYPTDKASADALESVHEKLVEALGDVLVDWPEPADWIDGEAEAQASRHAEDNLGGYQGPTELRPGAESDRLDPGAYGGGGGS